MGKNKKPRKPYRKKSDSLENNFSKKDKAIGKMNIIVLVSLCVVAAIFVVYQVS